MKTLCLLVVRHSILAFRILSLLEQKRIPEAVTVLRVNAEAHPDSWNVWDSLGEVYVAAGKVAEAIAAYERSLKLNPENRSGIDSLTLLRSKKP